MDMNYMKEHKTRVHVHKTPTQLVFNFKSKLYVEKINKKYLK